MSDDHDENYMKMELPYHPDTGEPLIDGYIRLSGPPNLTQQEMQELLPCPFCGGKNLSSGGNDYTVGYWCLDCEAVGPNHYSNYGWNVRSEAPKREWVGLTDEERSKIHNDFIHKKIGIWEVCDFCEAKLKEKNT